MPKRFYVRADVIGTNAAGQKLVRLLATNADGFHFWTDDKSLVPAPDCERELMEDNRVFSNLYIRNRLSCADLAGQLAEEATELSHAAQKLERVLRGTNPTPVTKPEAIQKVLEKTADVLNCLEVLRIYPDTESIKIIRIEKMDRWIRRLKETENA